jgi:23S rRNA (adenine2503-C2)-methyltransferase
MSSPAESDAAQAPDAGDRPRLTFAVPRRGKPPQHLADLDLSVRRQLLADAGLPAYRAEQVSRHYFGHHTGDPAQMTDLPVALRDRMSELLLPDLLRPVRTITCDNGMTRKTLWETFDKARIESVLMGYRDRATVCVSSQAGCGMACPFCATGQGGLTRNLSTAEIVGQVVEAAGTVARGELPGDVARLSNVVFMGMGEPLANYRAVLDTLHRLIAPVPDGLGLSARSLTVSTVGLAPAIRRLADEDLPVTLAVSLHAPDDELRDTLVPVNTRFPVAEVLDAAWYYADRTHRRVSIEYAMISGVNDQPERARHLAALLRDRLVHVNLIPLNPTRGSDWSASDASGERAFLHELRRAGIAATVRDTRGRDADAACGQLAADG